MSDRTALKITSAMGGWSVFGETTRRSANVAPPAVPSRPGYLSRVAYLIRETAHRFKGGQFACASLCAWAPLHCGPLSSTAARWAAHAGPRTRPSVSGDRRPMRRPRLGSSGGRTNC